MYSTPHYWNHIGIMQSKDNDTYDHNSKKSRKKCNMKWSGYFRVMSTLPVKRLVEDISLSKAYISWLNGMAIQRMSLHGNQERVRNTPQNS
jgi:hypothetical protein